MKSCRTPRKKHRNRTGTVLGTKPSVSILSEGEIVFLFSPKMRALAALVLGLSAVLGQEDGSVCPPLDTGGDPVPSLCEGDTMNPTEAAAEYSVCQPSTGPGVHVRTLPQTRPCPCPQPTCSPDGRYTVWVDNAVSAMQRRSLVDV